MTACVALSLASNVGCIRTPCLQPFYVRFNMPCTFLSVWMDTTVRTTVMTFLLVHSVLQVSASKCLQLQDACSINWQLGNAGYSWDKADAFRRTISAISPIMRWTLQIRSLVTSSGTNNSTDIETSANVELPT